MLPCGVGTATIGWPIGAASGDTCAAQLYLKCSHGGRIEVHRHPMASMRNGHRSQPIQWSCGYVYTAFVNKGSRWQCLITSRVNCNLARAATGDKHTHHCLYIWCGLLATSWTLPTGWKPPQVLFGLHIESWGTS